MPEKLSEKEVREWASKLAGDIVEIGNAESGTLIHNPTEPSALARRLTALWEGQSSADGSGHNDLLERTLEMVRELEDESTLMVGGINDLQERIAELERENEAYVAAYNAREVEDKQRTALAKKVIVLERAAETARREIDALAAALERLGSMEAMDVTRAVCDTDGELLSRIDYAREALAEHGPKKETSDD